MLPSRPAPPGEVHPAYADMPWLIDWINRRGPIKYDSIEIPVMPRLQAFTLDLDGPPPGVFEGIRTRTMTRHRAFGPAPYVGRPFVYTWWIGVDNLGRQIASESAIHYIEPEWMWPDAA